MSVNNKNSGCGFMAGVFFLLFLLWILKGVLFPPKFPAPEIKISFNTSYPGEQILSSEDSTRIIVTDRITIPNGKEGIFFGATVYIEIEPEEARQKKAKPILKIISEDGKNKNEEVSGEDSFSIAARDLKYGENKFRIVAENSDGSVTKNLVIEKKSLESVCRADATLKDDIDCDDFYKDEKAAERETILDTSATSGNLNNSSSAGSICYHFENNICWDEIEDQAYDDGYWDKNYGRYGDGYNPPENCTGFCEELYEDSYEEGFHGY